MLFIQEKDSMAPSRWFQITEIILYPEVSSILVTAYGLVDPNETFMVMDIKTRVATPEEIKLEFDKATTHRLELGYKKVENTRFRSLFKGETVG